jgi:hypothetical protein
VPFTAAQNMYFHFAASIKLIYFFIIGSISTGILLTITICGILGTLKVVTAILVMKYKNARNQNKNEDLRGLIDIRVV